MLPNPLPVGAPATPTHGVHVFLPVHYPIQGDDQLIQQIREFQRQEARKLGLDNDFAGIAHHDIYGAMFEIIHLEAAIRSRIGIGGSSHGRMTTIEGAIAESLPLEVGTVQSYRKAISKCRAGGRSQVPFLRVRERNRRRR